MQSRRGFFQTLLAAGASAMLPHVTPKSAPRLQQPGVWRKIPMDSTFMTVSRVPTDIIFFSEMGTCIGHTAGLARVDFQ
jgi:hypothetical protein